MSAQLQPHLRVNVIEGNRLLFGDAEVRLLEAIAQEGTLTEAATALGISYRVAWGKLRAMETSLGTRLVETTVGGSGGGSSRLTPAATRILGRYSAFRDAVGLYAIEQFEAHFGKGMSCSKLCAGEADSDSERPEIPATFLKTVTISDASGELV
jgi:molybdate transport system regulatory protein